MSWQTAGNYHTMRFELSSRQKHMAHLGLRLGAGWGGGSHHHLDGQGRCLGARPSISVYAEGLKIKQRRAQRKKNQETPFLTFWRTHVVAHFDDGDDEGDDDDGEDDDKHDDDVVQDLPCRRISDGVRVFVWTCISGLSSSDRVCLLCSSWGLHSLCRLLGILTRAQTPADR